ncbi:hypothetical protein [Thioclava sp. GXIMD4215]|uniref:hypothetical protein n=1 Tax=Thioclava sp. GXIMD4215 TaxID=3131928 RepID=UPI00311AEB11
MLGVEHIIGSCAGLVHRIGRREMPDIQVGVAAPDGDFHGLQQELERPAEAITCSVE